MTFLEKLKREHPEINTQKYNFGCPSKFGYEENRSVKICAATECIKCWNREIEEKGETNMITRKTKAELMEEIEAKNAEIKDLKKRNGQSRKI